MSLTPEEKRARQRAGIKASEKMGYYLGRKAEATKKNVETAQRLKDRGLTNEQIAKKLGVDKRTVTRYLKTPRAPFSPLLDAVMRVPKSKLLEVFCLAEMEAEWETGIAGLGPTERLWSPLNDHLRLLLLRKVRHPAYEQFLKEASNGVRESLERAAEALRAYEESGHG